MFHIPAPVIITVISPDVEYPCGVLTGSYGYMSRSGIAELYDNFTFRPLRSLHTDFYSRRANLQLR